MRDPLGPESGDVEHVDRPVAYAELRRALSGNSELVTVDGAGHSIHLDEPDSVVAAILAALD